ncbi:MAG: ribonuclease P protein component [Chloroflexota bacterium]|nr:ribonuclease P protein component [Chloroflexota bacterium]MBI5705220.1 ribonuclease P protein component [Chloroflexota bacterium]
MQRRFRLTRSEDFKRVRRSGKSYAHPLVVLMVQKSEQPRLRVGIAAGKTVGTAIRRNRAKRILREAMRSLIPHIASHFDLILIARPSLARASFEETRRALLDLFQRARLITPPHES